MPDTPALTYADAGVDVEAADRVVGLMKQAVSRTHGPEVFGGFGGFVGLYDASALKEYRRPLLVSSTDGVGTKVAIAQAMDIHDTIGADLIAMVIDDIVVCGARPLSMTDYIACGKLIPEKIALIVKGIAEACEQAGCALISGETAEHPDLLEPHEYDVAGAGIGVVEADELLGSDRVRAGDVAIALGSSGLHSNGFSLVRKVIATAGWSLDRHVDEFGSTLGEELLRPTRIYARDILGLIDAVSGVHSLTHVTGGGLAANLSRVLPQGVSVAVDRSTWTPQPVFDVVARLGGVPRDDLERSLNVGVGMVAVVDPAVADATLRFLNDRDVPAWVLGEIRSDPEFDRRHSGAVGVVRSSKGVDGGGVLMVGEHPKV